MSLTRFERARIIGARALQISMGAPPLVDVRATDPIEIALAEFEKGLVPMTSTRVWNARD
jgi:DNA-directed RNA polymerase subunit K